MYRTLLVMTNEIGATLRRKVFIIFAFGVPLVVGIVVLVMSLTNRAPATSPGGPEDELPPEQQMEGLVDVGNLIEAIPDDVPPDWLTEFGTEAEAQTALDRGTISGYYVIPGDYVETGDVTYVVPEYNPISGDVPTGRIEWVLLYNILGGDADLAASTWNPIKASETRLAAPEGEDLGDSPVARLFPTFMALTLYIVIIIPAGVLVSSLTDEKKNRVMEVLVSSVSPYQLIGGKILALGLLGLLQTAVWVGVLWAVLSFGGQSLSIPAGFEVPVGLFAWAFVFFLLGYAMYGAQMAAVGALAPDVKDTRGVTMLVNSPLIVVYLFLTGIVARPGGSFAIVLSLFPLTAPVGMIARMAVTEVPVWQPVVSAGLQFLTAFLIIRVVARLFRAQTLLSGQPLSPRRFIRAVFGRA